MRRIPKHHHRIADVFVYRSALGEERLRQCGEIPGRLVHEGIRVGGFSNGCEPAHVRKDNRDFLPDAAQIGGNGFVEKSPDDLLGNKVRERPDSVLRKVHRGAEFLYLLDI